MSNPYVGEIRLFAGSFAPTGWLACDGQLLPISEYDALFNLIGTTYGGDGSETFALPDLRGRVPVHQGSGYIQGQSMGNESVSLSTTQIPSHRHRLEASSDPGTSSTPARHAPASSDTVEPYASAPPKTEMSAGAIGPAGGGAPHDNMQPYLPLTFIIAWYGIYPSQ